MSTRYDAIVIGSGLGGLTAAALLARAGRKVLVLERNYSLGGAASTYKVGDLTVEASLHETADPHWPLDAKHRILDRIGVLDAVEWVPVGSMYEVRGGPVGAPFTMPDNFADARAALADRFPQARAATAGVLGDIERIATAIGAFSQGRDILRDPRNIWRALRGLGPLFRDGRRSLGEVFDRAFDDNEAIKCALAANLGYYHDDPDTLWWVFFAQAQGSFLNAGASYIRGGSQRLSFALMRAIKAAGGEVVLRRRVSDIRLGSDGAPSAVVHTDRDGGDRTEVAAPIVISGAAPAALADMLPDAPRKAFHDAYATVKPSVSLFALTLGLSEPGARFGLQAYSTFLLPPWMKQLKDFPRGTNLFADEPHGDMPPFVIADYSAIDSGLGGPPYPVSIVGLDHVDNWRDLGDAAYADKRARWQDAIVAAADRAFPGIASHVTASAYNTARTMQSYLGTPGGAVYGFAPAPPTGSLWRGFDRSPRTPVPRLYLASAYAASGGFSGAIVSGALAADCVLGSPQPGTKD